MRNYKPKAKRFNQYDIEKLREATQMVFSKTMTVSEASRIYNIPRTTINNHVTVRCSGKDKFFLSNFKENFYKNV
jgi:hypothetical protein